MTKPTIVSLAETQINNDVVAILEDFLGMARKGEITAIAMSATTPGKEVYTGRSGEQGLALVGGLEYIKSRVLENL